MTIHEYYYNKEDKFLEISFSNSDDEYSYRREVLTLYDIQLYSPTIIEEIDLYNIDNEFIVELLEEYYKNNELPDEQIS